MVLIFLVIFVISSLIILKFNRLNKDLIKSQEDFINLKNYDKKRKYYEEVFTGLDPEILFSLDQKLNKYSDLIINQKPIISVLNNGFILKRYNTKLHSGIHFPIPVQHL